LNYIFALHKDPSQKKIFNDIIHRGDGVIPVLNVKNYKESIMKMGFLVEDLFDRSIYALVNREENVAKGVITSDKAADEMRNTIIEEALFMVGEYSPIGKSLVEISNGILIVNLLEMIGDNSKKIAYNTIDLVREPMLKPLIDLPKMASIAEEMLRKSLSIYIEGADSNTIDDLLEKESMVDELNSRIEDELKLYMMDSAKNVNRALKLIFVSHYIEEVTDLCLKISNVVG